MEQLLKIPGFKIDRLPFNVERVGDLSYFDGPLLSVFQDGNGAPVIFKWAEFKEGIERWLVFQTSKRALADYVYKRLPLDKLLLEVANSVAFIVDYSLEGEIVSVITISPSMYPYKYMPVAGILFDEEDAKGLQNIIHRFRLDEIDLSIEESKEFDILEEARIANSELVNIHIDSKSGRVNFGKIYASVLGSILDDFTKLSRTTSVNIFDHVGKLPKESRPRRKHGELRRIELMGEYEYIAAKAASFSVFIKPVYSELDTSNVTSSAKIINQIFSLFENSQALDTLIDFKESLSGGVLSAFNDLLKDIKSKELDVLIQYGNTQVDDPYILKFEFTPPKADRILKILDELEYANEENIKISGVFSALDNINHSFKFTDFEDAVYVGRFSEAITDKIQELDLKNYYSLTMNRIVEKRSKQKIEKETYVALEYKIIADRNGEMIELNGDNNPDQPAQPVSLF